MYVVYKKLNETDLRNIGVYFLFKHVLYSFNRGRWISALYFTSFIYSCANITCVSNQHEIAARAAATINIRPARLITIKYDCARRQLSVIHYSSADSTSPQNVRVIYFTKAMMK